MVWLSTQRTFLPYKNKCCLPPGYWPQCFDNNGTCLFSLSVLQLRAGAHLKHTARYESLCKYFDLEMVFATLLSQTIIQVITHFICSRVHAEPAIGMQMSCM